MSSLRHSGGGLNFSYTCFGPMEQLVSMHCPSLRCGETSPGWSEVHHKTGGSRARMWSRAYTALAAHVAR